MCPVVEPAEAPAEFEAVVSAAPYGPAFFELLHRFDAVFVAVLSNEAPRIIVDAHLQGAPVIDSTLPEKALVEDRTTGVLYKAESPHHLASTTADLLRPGSQQRLRTVGEDALTTASDYDHLKLHSRKSRFLRAELSRARR